MKFRRLTAQILKTRIKMDATELFCMLWENEPLKDLKWWPEYGKFDVVIGAILAQNAKWQKVQISLLNLRERDLLNLRAMCEIEPENLAKLIAPSGFYNIKSARIKSVCEAIAAKFGDFESFCELVKRPWLHKIKGVGDETCDSILCYACGREVMVADSYSARILGAFGYEFDSYDELSEWLSELDFKRVFSVCGAYDVNTVYCAFHGLIDEFCNAHFKGGKFDEKALRLFENLR